MRSKELSNDYRYFPDPDLLPLHLDEAFIESVRRELPELPEEKRTRYQAQLGLSEYDARFLTQDPDLAAYFETVADAAAEPKLAANWIMGELSAVLNRDELSAAECPLPAATVGRLIQRIQDGTISGKIAKELFEKLWKAARTGDVPDVDATIEAEGMTQVSDTGEIAAIIDGIVAANPAQVEQFKAGKEKVLGFFVGQVMKETQGKANPKVVNDLLREALAR